MSPTPTFAPSVSSPSAIGAQAMPSGFSGSFAPSTLGSGFTGGVGATSLQSAFTGSLGSTAAIGFQAQVRSAIGGYEAESSKTREMLRKLNAFVAKLQITEQLF